MAEDLTTAEVAAEIRMSEDWVREHAAELGGYRVSGPRSPLRFEREAIADWTRHRRLAPPSPPPRKSQRPGRRRAVHGVELVPLPAGR